MLRVAALLIVAAPASPALAQSTGAPPNQPAYSGYSEGSAWRTTLASYDGLYRSPRPTKYSDAQIDALRALRDEANALQASDGGTLTTRHKRYVNAQVARILRD